MPLLQFSSHSILNECRWLGEPELIPKFLIICPAGRIRSARSVSEHARPDEMSPRGAMCWAIGGKQGLLIISNSSLASVQTKCHLVPAGGVWAGITDEMAEQTAERRGGWRGSFTSNAASHWLQTSPFMVNNTSLAHSSCFPSHFSPSPFSPWMRTSSASWWRELGRVSYWLSVTAVWKCLKTQLLLRLALTDEDALQCGVWWGIRVRILLLVFFFWASARTLTQNHRFQFPSKAAVTNVIWLAGQVQIHNSMNKHTIWMKRVVSFIISISGINGCGARTAGDLCLRKKVCGLWLGAAVLHSFYFLWVKCPPGEIASAEAMEPMQMRHLPPAPTPYVQIQYGSEHLKHFR